MVSQVTALVVSFCLTFDAVDLKMTLWNASRTTHLKPGQWRLFSWLLYGPFDGAEE